MRDYAEVAADGAITGRGRATGAGAASTSTTLGLDDVDRRILRAIIEKFGGGPVGMETIAAAICEEADTIMDVYEPYLMQLGFLQRSPAGRVRDPGGLRVLGAFPITNTPRGTRPERARLFLKRIGR